MNKIFKVIYNHHTQSFQAVCEYGKSNNTTSASKPISKPNKKPTIKAKILAILIGSFCSSIAFAAPTGGEVVAGQANIAQIGATTNINQASQNAVINWQDFGIKAHETVNFHQPSSEAVTLNRVIGNQRSVIDGAMNANGKVFIQNEHGTLIGKNAQINVGSLVATTAKISDDDFMKGNYRFDNAQGDITNLGTITVPQGGVVALIAPIVKNSGTIVAPQGKVLLASADSFSITLPDNVNFSYTLDKGTLQGLVDNGGAIIADGGRIVLTALGVDTVKKSLIKHTGAIEANTVRNVNGVIELVGDLDNSALDVSGSLKAEGKGDDKGGLIETSASTVKIDDNAQVSTQADNGKTGTWLIDPKDFVVAPTGGDITGAKVSAGLQNNNVTLKSRDGAKEGNGDVIVNDEIRWEKNTLTLNADHDIHINANLNGTGSAKLALEYGQGSEYGTYKVMVDGKETTKDNDYHIQKDTPLAQRTVKINLPEGKNFSTKQGSNGDTHEFAVIHQMPNIVKNGKGDWESKFTERNIALGADIDVGHTKQHDGFAGWQLPKDGNDEWGRVAGLGHTVSNLTLYTKKVLQPTGLFQKVYKENNSYIRDIGVVNATVKSEGDFAYSGILASRGLNIYHSYATGNISTTGLLSQAGGLVGIGVNIHHSYATSNVSTTGKEAQAGGLVGNGNNIYHSYATGNVSTKGDGKIGTGGLVGWGDHIYHSYATGNVSSAGNGKPNTVSQNSATQITTGQYEVGTGGLVGRGDNIQDSYATGNVSTTGRHSQAGGLVGDGHIIHNSYATGDVSVTGDDSQAGGLVGRGNGRIYNSYADNKVSATGANNIQGGIVGHYGDSLYGNRDSSSSNSFFNQAKSNLQAIGKIESNPKLTNVTGKTEAELKQKVTFTDWDFDNIWYINKDEIPKLHTHKKGTVVINLNKPLSKVYDGKAVASDNDLRAIAKANGYDDMATITGLKDGDSLGGKLRYDGGNWQNAKNAGEYTIISSGLIGDQNYEIKYGEGSLTINKRQLNITGTKVYDGTNTVLGSDLRLTDVVPGDDVSLKAGTQGKIADKNVGTHKITDADTLAITGTNANNYVANPQNVRVTPKALNIDVSKDFDDSPIFNAGFKATNLIGSDKADVVGTATVADKQVGTYQDFVSASLTSNNRNYAYVQGASAVNAVIKAVSQPVPPTTTNPTPKPVTPSPTPVVPQPTTPTPIVPQPVQPQPVVPVQPVPATPTPQPTVQPTPTITTPALTVLPIPSVSVLAQAEPIFDTPNSFSAISCYIGKIELGRSDNQIKSEKTNKLLCGGINSYDGYVLPNAR